MEFDKALNMAVILGWDDLCKTAEPVSVRVEYLSKKNAPLQALSVWAVDSAGHQFLVCECWTEPAANHARGARFGSRYNSASLGKGLDFIMANQQRFPRPESQTRGLVQVAPPSEMERMEANSWAENMKEPELTISTVMTLE